MATKKALVLNTDGQIEQLQAGDTLAGAGSPSVIAATDTFDFGSLSDAVVKTITNASLTSANFNSFTVIPQETSGASLDDFKLNGVVFNIENIVDSTSFDIRATAIDNA